MKVIVQNIATGLYLSADGAWVAEEDAARDFGTLLRAFHFATDNVACRFQVMLYSADDDYVACIIEGDGQAEPAPSPRGQAAEAAISFSRIGGYAHTGFFRGIRFDETRNHLN
jgi:hypothetical protein